MESRRTISRSEGTWCALLLLILATTFWKCRILDTGMIPINIGSVDLYIEIIPTAKYGYEVLRTGGIPLWNPYQFVGEPFLAVPYTALFYPLHFIAFFVDIATWVEVLLVLHMCFAGASMWWLARHLKMRNPAALAAGLGFMWSGWMIANNTLLNTFEAMCWAPLTVLMIDRVLLDRRLAWLGLVGALACQLLLGSMEIAVHNMYAGGLFALCRIAQLAWGGQWIVALRRGALLLVCIVATALLVGAQLLPTLELMQLSVRSAGTLVWALASLGSIPPMRFLESAVENRDMATVGVLPFLGIALALGFRRYQLVWVFALTAGAAAVFLVFGGAFYRLYYEIPVVGSLFRRPFKFLDIYGFAQALLAGLAIERLHGWTAAGRREVVAHPAWLLSLAIGGAAFAWLVSRGSTNWYWPAMVAVLLAFGAVAAPSVRIGCIVGLVVLHAMNLFFTVYTGHQRPMQQPYVYETHQVILEWLKSQLGYARVYISPKFLSVPGLTPKQGMWRKMFISLDYQALAGARYQPFFEAVQMRGTIGTFWGQYELGPSSRWQLMDLTGTKFFIMQRGEPGEVFMSRNPAEFQFVLAQKEARVFAKRNVLPRAYFVTRARAFTGPNEVLVALGSPGFDPRAQVLLEEPAAELPTDAAVPGGRSEVSIVSYEPERVVVAAEVDAPGFLVLGDLFYPGWKAFVGDREVPIYRANYLFRAVRLDPGTSEVRFEYRPASFRLGILLSAITALVLGAAAVSTVRRRASTADRVGRNPYE